MESLFDTLKQYGESGYYPYHMPGHKRQDYGRLPVGLAGMDITEIDGFDNLHQPEGILRELQERAAELYGAEESFYLINGSTCGILSAVSAALPRGGHLLMSRNCHKSVYHGAYLRQLRLSYLYPPMLPGFGICDCVTPKQVEEALEQERDIGAVLLVSPTYEGRLADIGKIAETVHKRGIPLIVDEAHGAHLGFGEGFGENSCRLGADLVIHSVHKTLPALTQTALLHVNGKLVDRELLRRFLHIYQSSSPSYILMASIDNALRLVEGQGKKLFADFYCRYRRMMEQLEDCQCLQFVPWEAGRQDVGKLVIASRSRGISGQRIYDILRDQYHLQLEMGAGEFCLAMFTVGDTEEGYRRMTQALLALDQDIASGRILPEDGQSGCQYGAAEFYGRQTKGRGKGPCGALPFAASWEMPWEWAPLSEGVGRHVADFINFYPPGVPILVPGEVLTEEAASLLRAGLEQGLPIQGMGGREEPLVKTIVKGTADKFVQNSD